MCVCLLHACTGATDAEPKANTGGAGATSVKAGEPGNGSGGRASGTGGRAGASGTAAAAGTGSSCTQNLACKLSPPPSSGDIRQDCVNRINQFRKDCACLGPLERWTEGEACADKMAEHDSMTGMAHSGFSSKVCSPGGNAQNECPKYGSEASVISTCLQQMWNEGPPPQTPCNGDCFQKYGHFINMTNPKLKKVACGFHKPTSGSLWAVQNFSP